MSISGGTKLALLAFQTAICRCKECIYSYEFDEKCNLALLSGVLSSCCKALQSTTARSQFAEAPGWLQFVASAESHGAVSICMHSQHVIAQPEWLLTSLKYKNVSCVLYLTWYHDHIPV